MKLPVFQAEQWMTRYEGQAAWNLTDTSVKPLAVKDLLARASQQLDTLVLDYGTIDGDKKLKDQILSLYSSGDPSSITTAAGCLHANEMVMRLLLNPGDHVITWYPGYEQFVQLPLSIGCTVSQLPYHEENHWQIDLDEFQAAIRPETKLVVFNNPSNPTGALIEEATLRKLVTICRSHGIWMLCDEVYRGLHLELTPSISDLYERGIATGSLSKAFSLPGLRLGWVKAVPSLIQELNYYRDYTFITSGVLDEALAFVALENKEFIISRANDIIEVNKTTLLAWLEKNPRFQAQIPRTGTVTLMKYDLPVKSEDFCRQLLAQTGVFFVPGIHFQAEYHVRLSLGQDNEMFKTGLSILSAWVEKNWRLDR